MNEYLTLVDISKEYNVSTSHLRGLIGRYGNPHFKEDGKLVIKKGKTWFIHKSVCEEVFRPVSSLAKETKVVSSTVKGKVKIKKEKRKVGKDTTFKVVPPDQLHKVYPTPELKRQYFAELAKHNSKK